MKLYLLKKVLISTAIIIFASISSTQKTLAEPPQKTYAIAPFISDKEIKWGTLYKNSGDFKALGGLEIMSDITTQTLAELVKTVISLSNTASVAELIVNCRPDLVG